jgi:hypothetical protein
MIRKTNNTDPFEKMMIFLKKYWLFILAIIMGYPYLKRWLQNQEQQTKENQAENAKAESMVINKNPITQQQRRDKLTSRKDIQRDAILLAHHLGTKYSDVGDGWVNWFKGVIDPKGWTENDREAANILMRERNNILLLERLYFTCETNSRNLRADVLKYLDTSELKRVQKVLKI